MSCLIGNKYEVCFNWFGSIENMDSCGDFGISISLGF